jgi:drug/metabolite transporter (DMT)-like permease
MSPHPHASHVPVSAVLLVVGAVALFTTADVIAKYLAERYPVPLVVLGRHGIQALVMIAWLAPRRGWGIVRSAQPLLQIARGSLLVGSSLFFIGALRWLPLADATAINYTTPILVVLLSVVLLNERMTRARWAFVAAGFVGMLLIIRPGASILHGAALLVLGAATCYAFYQVLTRKLRGDDPLVTLIYPALCGTVMMAALLPFLDYRAAMSWTDLSLLVLFGAPATLGHFLFIRAFQLAPASALTPFTYAQLVWAVLFGWVFFGNFPDRWSLAGMAIIAASGLLLAWHERRQGRALQRAVPEEPTVVD